MMVKRKSFAACLSLLLLAMACGSDDGEDGIESETERLTPASNICLRTDTCVYGHCSTEDGVCNQSPACTPGSQCQSLCYGTCVATPRPTRD